MRGGRDAVVSRLLTDKMQCVSHGVEPRQRQGRQQQHREAQEQTAAAEDNDGPSPTLGLMDMGGGSMGKTWRSEKMKRSCLLDSYPSNLSLEQVPT